MGLKIGNVELPNNVIAAPLAGISNLAYRKILHRMGAGLVCAEMVSDKAIVYDNKKTLNMLKVSKVEHPVSMQIFGADADSLVTAAKYVDKHCDCDIIDINMGCPVPKVVKTGAGSKMMTNPEHTYKLIKAVVAAVHKPVTVKMRLGWDRQSINCVAMAKLMEKAGVSAITLHARTRSEFYEGQSHWEYIKQVKESVKIPVIGNGDIKTPQDAERMLQETGCDGVMIGRGLLGNPWLIQETVHYLEIGEKLKEPTLHAKIKMCLQHARALIRLYQNEENAIKEMRSHTCWYIKGYPHASKYKAQIHQVNTYQELEKLLHNFEINCKTNPR